MVDTLSGSTELSEITDSLFFDVQNNLSGSQHVLDLLETDSSLVDKLDSDIPEHIRAVADYFHKGENNSGEYDFNIAAAAYFCIVNPYNNSVFEHDSIQSLQQHLKRFSREDPIDNAIEKDGTQFVVDNKQNQPDSKYFIAQRGFSDDSIYEIVIAERRRKEKGECPKKGEYPVVADIFVALRDRSNSHIDTYAATYDFKMPIGILGFMNHINNNMRSILNKEKPESYMHNMLDHYSQDNKDLMARPHLKNQKT